MLGFFALGRQALGALDGGQASAISFSTASFAVTTVADAFNITTPVSTASYSITTVVDAFTITTPVAVASYVVTTVADAFTTTIPVATASYTVTTQSVNNPEVAFVTASFAVTSVPFALNTIIPQSIGSSMSGGVFSRNRWRDMVAEAEARAEAERKRIADEKKRLRAERKAAKLAAEQAAAEQRAAQHDALASALRDRLAALTLASRPTGAQLLGPQNQAHQYVAQIQHQAAMERARRQADDEASIRLLQQAHAADRQRLFDAILRGEI